MNTLIEHISFWGAVIGATLLALNLPISGWAYIPFMLSNLTSIYIMKKRNGPKIISYQIGFFVIINIIGIVRWLL